MSKLLVLKFRSYKNSLLYGQNRKKAIGGLAFFLAIAGGLLYLLLTRVPRGGTLGPTGDFLLVKGLQVGFLLAFFYLLIGGINTSLNSLYLSGDLNLLRCLPIRSRTVFTYKFVSSWMDNSTFVSSIAIPILTGYGIYSEVGPMYYLLMIVGLLALTGLTTGISTLLTLLAVKFSPPNRLRRTFQFLGGLVGAVLYLIFYITFYTGNSEAGLSSGQLARLEAIFSHPAVEWLPGGWLASSLSYFAGQGSLTSFLVKFGLLLGTTTAIFWISRTLLAWSFAEGTATVQEVPTEEKERSEDFTLSQSKLPFTVLVIWAVAKKEFRVYLRDLRVLGKLWFLFAASIVGPTMIFSQSNTVGPVIIPYFGLVAGWFFLYICGVGIFSLSFFSERENTSGMFTSPLTGERLVKAKIITYYVPTTLVSEIYHIIGSMLVGAPVIYLISGLLIIPLVSLGANSLGIAIAVSFGKLNVIDPHKCLPATWRTLNIILSVVYLGIVGAAVVATLHPESLPYVDYFGQVIRQIAGGLLLISIPFSVSYFSIKFAGKRLLKREW